MELEDKEFYDLLAEKRHKELSGTLKVIANVLSIEKDDGVVTAIEKQCKSIEDFAGAIKLLPKPEVNVSTNQDKVVASVKEMGDAILKGLSELQSTLEQKKEWVFKVNLRYDRIDTVTATQTNIIK